MKEAEVITHPYPSREGTMGAVQEGTMGAVMDKDAADLVVDEIIERIKAFDAAIEANQILAIDGLAVDGAPCDKITPESRVKVINHQTRQAYEVEVDTIIQTPLKDLILALETGEFMRCFGITRIN